MREGGDPAGVPVLDPRRHARIEPALRAAPRGRGGARDQALLLRPPGLRRLDPTAGPAGRRLRDRRRGGLRRPRNRAASACGESRAAGRTLWRRLRCFRIVSPPRPRWRRSHRLDAEGLDFTAGMGELNVESFEASMGSEEAHRAQHELGAGGRSETPRRRASSRPGARSSAPPTSRCSRPRSPSSGSTQITAGIVPSSDGWFDDDLVFVEALGVRRRHRSASRSRRARRAGPVRAVRPRRLARRARSRCRGVADRRGRASDDRPRRRSTTCTRGCSSGIEA